MQSKQRASQCAIRAGGACLRAPASGAPRWAKQMRRWAAPVAPRVLWPRPAGRAGQTASWPAAARCRGAQIASAAGVSKSGPLQELSARRAPRARVFSRNAARRRDAYTLKHVRAKRRRVRRTRRTSSPWQAPAQRRGPTPPQMRRLSAQPRPPARARWRALLPQWRSPCRRRTAPQLASRRTQTPIEPRARQRRRRPARPRRRLRP